MYTRGEIAKKARISFETLRFYENEGVMPVPKRSENGYRLYDEDDFNRLIFIIRAKECGFTLREIKDMFSAIHVRKSNKELLKETVSDKLMTIDKKMESLQHMKELLLQVMINADNPDCHFLYHLVNESER